MDGGQISPSLKKAQIFINTKQFLQFKKPYKKWSALDNGKPTMNIGQPIIIIRRKKPTMDNKNPTIDNKKLTTDNENLKGTMEKLRRNNG